MRKRPKLVGQPEDQSQRVLRIAREIILQTGDFALPMRTLAARAKVSLSVPYALFGSKTGIITAILNDDQAAWRKVSQKNRPSDPVEYMFASLQRGMEFIGNKEPFYKALLRATGAFADANRGDSVTRQIHHGMSVALHEAKAAGCFAKDTDPALIAEILTDVWSAELRLWGNSDFPIRVAYCRTGFGWSAVLSGALRDATAARMSRQMEAFQQQLSPVRSGKKSGNGAVSVAD